MKNLLNWIVKTSIYSLVFLLPIFFLPFSVEAFEFNKQYLLYFLTSVAFFAWLAKQILFDKEIKFYRTIFNVPVLFFLLAALLSAVFSVDKVSSIFGSYGRFSNGLIAQISFVLLYFLIVNNVDIKSGALSKKQTSPGLTANGILTAFFASVFFAILASCLSVLGIFAKISGIFSIGFLGEFLINPTSGSWKDFAVFLAIAAVLLSVKIIIKENGRQRYLILFYYLLLVLAMALMFIVGFTAAWLLFLTALILFLAIAVCGRFFKEDARKLLLPVVLIAIGAIPIFFSNFIFQPSALRSQIEREVPTLSKKESALVGFKAATENLKSGLLGSGIGTFSYDFSKFNSAELSQNRSWRLQYGWVRFNRAGSNFFEILGTMGFLGLMALIFLIALPFANFWPIIKSRAKTKKNPFDRIKSLFQRHKPKPLSIEHLPLLTVFLALAVSQFFYYQNTVLAFTFWLQLALLSLNWRGSEHVFAFKDFPELSLVVKSLLAVFGISLLGTYFFAAKFYAADVAYKEALRTQDQSLREEKFEKAVELNPRQSQYGIFLAAEYFNRALNETAKSSNEQDLNLIKNSTAKAIDQGLKAVSISPNNVFFWQVLGGLYRESAGLIEGAEAGGIAAFKEAALLEPKNPDLHLELGKLYFSSGDTARAKTSFEKARQLESVYPEPSFYLAIAYETEGKLSEAITIMEETVKDSPDSAQAFFYLGRLYLKNNRTDEAIAVFKRVAASVPNDPNALYFLGLALAAKGEKELAIQTLEKVLELNPGNEEIVKKIEELKK